MHSLTYKKQTSLGFRSYKTPAFFFSFCFLTQNFIFRSFRFNLSFLIQAINFSKNAFYFIFHKSFFFKRGWLHFFLFRSKIVQKKLWQSKFAKTRRARQLEIFFAPRLFFFVKFCNLVIVFFATVLSQLFDLIFCFTEKNAKSWWSVASIWTYYRVARSGFGGALRGHGWEFLGSNPAFDDSFRSILFIASELNFL